MPNSEPRASDEIGKEFWKEWRQIHDWVFAGTKGWGLTIGADHQVLTLAPGVVRGGMLRGSYSAVAITRHSRPFLRQLPPAGKYVFRYSLSSAKGDWRATKSYRAGMALNNSLIPVSPADDLSGKTLPPSQSFCSVEGGNLVVSALKKAESGNALILRVYDTVGARAETEINLLGRARRWDEVNLIEGNIGLADKDVLRIAPFEIKTVRLAIDRRP
jgi:alpha-mannosidase